VATLVRALRCTAHSRKPTDRADERFRFFPSFSRSLSRLTKGAVSIAEYLGTKVAVKRLFDLDDDMKIYLQRELNVLKQIRHPNIVQFLGLSKTHDGLYLVTEFVERGDLCRQLYDRRAAPELDSWSLRLRILVGAAQGLAYLHAKNLIHRDIKAANYLVGDNWTVKLCDFGFSRSIGAAAATPSKQLQAGNQMTLCGTDEWMAPETMMGLDYVFSADVFSFAVFITEVIFRAEPDQRNPGTGYRFEISKFNKMLTHTPDCPRDLPAIVLDGTTYDPKGRPPMKSILSRLQALAKTHQDAPAPAPAPAPTPVAVAASPAPVVAAVTAAGTPVATAAPAAPVGAAAAASPRGGVSESSSDDGGEARRLTKSKKKKDKHTSTGESKHKEGKEKSAKKKKETKDGKDTSKDTKEPKEGGGDDKDHERRRHRRKEAPA
jgi:serine/threonine protein kinase